MHPAQRPATRAPPHLLHQPRLPQPTLTAHQRHLPMSPQRTTPLQQQPTTLQPPPHQRRLSHKPCPTPPHHLIHQPRPQQTPALQHPQRAKYKIITRQHACRLIHRHSPRRRRLLHPHRQTRRKPHHRSTTHTTPARQHPTRRQPYSRTQRHTATTLPQTTLNTQRRQQPPPRIVLIPQRIPKIRQHPIPHIPRHHTSATLHLPATQTPILPQQSPQHLPIHLLRQPRVTHQITKQHHQLTPVRTHIAPAICPIPLRHTPNPAPTPARARQNTTATTTKHLPMPIHRRTTRTPVPQH